MDEKTGLHVPVYYIIFTLIDLDNTEYIQKKYIENINDIGDVDRYYYYRKNDESDDNRDNHDKSLVNQPPILLTELREVGTLVRLLVTRR